MSNLICNGWNIFFYPLFNTQWIELVDRVKVLKQNLVAESFATHSDVKLLKALDLAIKEKIPQDPFASYFSLKKPLQKYSRVKKMGLPERYRLFFRAFREEKIIIILWLGFPRKEGDKKDCYTVFTKKVNNSDFPTTLDELLVECETETLEQDNL